MPEADRMNHTWRGSLSLQSPPTTAEGPQTTTINLMPVTSQMRRIPSRNNFKAVSMSPQDDPAQSSISPCSASFCLVSLYHPAKNVLINITGKRSASGEKLCLCQNCPPFLIFEIFILITISQRGHILPQTHLHRLNLQDNFLVLTLKLFPTCGVLSVVSPFITIYQAQENVPGKR